MQCPKFLYHMDNHIDQVSYVTYEEQVSRTLKKKKNWLGSILKKSRHQTYLTKYKKIKWSLRASIITTFFHKTLKHRALKKILLLFSRLSLTLTLGGFSHSVAMSVCVTVCVFVCLCYCETPTSGCLWGFCWRYVVVALSVIDRWHVTCNMWNLT